MHEVQWGSRELANRVYVSIRDRNWDTVLPVISGLRILRDDVDPLVVRFDGRNRSDALDVKWQGTVRVSTDGRLVYDMEGLAQSDFSYCRIGFCVLHSDALVAGRPYTADTPRGRVDGVLPELVAPQWIIDGREAPLFPACSAYSIDLGGVVARVTFEGSLFAMEDQRNWTDASFKTCCTVETKYPYQARRGQRFAQRVTISASGSPSIHATRSQRMRRVWLDHREARDWPMLGLGTSTQLDRPLVRRELDRLRTLDLDHVRIDVRLASQDWQAVLERGVRDARAIGAQLELALFADESTADRAADLRSLIRPSDIARLLVFDEATAANRTTPVGLYDKVRRRAAPALGSCPAFGGTDGDFAELNRDRPPFGAFDGLTYALNPQVHAFDDASLMETLRTQATTVATTCSFAGSRPVIVSPVTLRQRFNPAATTPIQTPAGGALPTPVDPRQMSLLAAGWTLGSIAALASAGAASMTYFETVGWRGIIEAARGPLPSRSFPSSVGVVFPVYHLFADLRECRRGFRLQVEPATGHEVAAVASTADGITRVLLANLTPRAVEITVGPLPGRTAWARVLAAPSALDAMLAPARFRRRREPITMQREAVRVRLPPFAYVRLDAASGRSA